MISINSKDLFKGINPCVAAFFNNFYFASSMS